MSSDERGKLEHNSAEFRCYEIDPIGDPRWANLLETHPSASIFHTVNWLRALSRTYGYKPVAFTTSPPDSKLRNGVVFCLVDSWLTGKRLVSLPFSDHCEPLGGSLEDIHFLIYSLQCTLEETSCKYFQLRPVSGDFARIDGGKGCSPDAEYFLHTIDLRPELGDLFCGFDKDSVQRRVQRAGRAGLVEKCGRSEDLLRIFYKLFLITRRRQKVPPAPYAWFQNLVQELSDALEIRVACKDEIPVAAIITLRFRDVCYYKYGCSDARFNNYGATPWLFWKAITAEKCKGAVQFDLGRTEVDNPGLLAFKNQWVRHPKRLIYWRYPSSGRRPSGENWKRNLTRDAFSLLPGKLQAMIGAFLYPHIG